jgi:prephenate dehydrogenase
MKIGIVGLGLMGGSLAIALKNVLSNIIIKGYDHNKNHEKEAKELGFVDDIVEFDEIKKCDIIILSIPVDGIISVLSDLEDIDKDTTIIDLGSTKDKIIKNTPPSIRENLVAAHPMAGTEKSGPNASVPDLYSNKVVVFCDVKDSADFHKQRAVDLFLKIGMKIVYMNSDEHDLDAAYISHLPHAISFALANTVLKQEDPKSILALAGGGFKDMSRIAKSSPNMWVDVFKQNRSNLLETIDEFEKELSLLKSMVKDENWDDLDDFMQSANTLHKIL